MHMCHDIVPKAALVHGDGGEIDLVGLFKRIATRPDWLHAQGVVDIYSLSGCVSANFADYVQYWKHNGYCVLPTRTNPFAFFLWSRMVKS